MAKSLDRKSILVYAHWQGLTEPQLIRSPAVVPASQRPAQRLHIIGFRRTEARFIGVELKPGSDRLRPEQ